MPIDLSQAERVRRSRFILRSLLYFWPIVDSPDDIDRVTRLAFSICLMDLLINTVTLLPDLLRPDWRAWTILAVLAVSCFLGANAVRQKSVPAAAMLTLIAATHVPVAFLMGHHSFPYIATTIFIAYTIAWRGVVLAARFGSPSSDQLPLHRSDIYPLVFRTAVSRYMTDKLPPKIWPAWQGLFWITASVEVIFNLGSLYLYTYVLLGN